jgi:hypothetical protein
MSAETVADLASHLTSDQHKHQHDLEKLLGLDKVQVKVLSATVTGQGSRASVQIKLSNGELLEFDSIRDMVRPQNLIAEVAACTGANPTLKQPQAVTAITLVRQIAERVRTATTDDTATSWGIEYLQTAEVLDVDLDDQAERWAAFKHLELQHPIVTAHDAGQTAAAASIVLRHLDGIRLVRTGWFRDYVRREQDHTISPAQLHQRMQRVGWKLRGSAGRWKATSPGPSARPLIWTFYAVPADWGEVNG